MKNWASAGGALRRSVNSHQSEPVILQFRNGKVLDGVDPSLAIAYLHYYDFARKMGTYSDADFQVVVSLGAEITRSLSTKFSPGEMSHSSTGARFGVHNVFLFLTVRKYRPRRIVETGVAQGVSSYTMLKALELNGQGSLISIDLPNRNPAGFNYRDGSHDAVYVPGDLPPGWLVPEDLRGAWSLKLGSSSSILPTLEGEIDMFHHDSEHSYENMMFEFEWAFSHLGKGGIVSSDDIDWNNAYRDFARRHPEMKPVEFSKVFPALMKI